MCSPLTANPSHLPGRLCRFLFRISTQQLCGGSPCMAHTPWSPMECEQ
ncbi:hypothetical protein ID866_9066 [Astraeus odoratus]|nr:hypothetical protein ID866_9066 [Astraeus odoratus]